MNELTFVIKSFSLSLCSLRSSEFLVKIKSFFDIISFNSVRLFSFKAMVTWSALISLLKNNNSDHENKYNDDNNNGDYNDDSDSNNR